MCSPLWGGWGPIAQKVIAVLGRALSARSGKLAAIKTDRLGHAMSFTLQRENARAVLRWRAVAGLLASPLGR